MSSSDLKDLEFAVGYDLAFVFLALVLWYSYIRPARRDVFRPNPKDVITHLADDHSPAPPESAAEASSGRRCFEVCAAHHWLVRLWKWPIENYASTDVYLYLLFQRTCAILFLTISVLTLSIGLPVIWTASSPLKEGADGQPMAKTFFDRAVILNVPTDSFGRLWVLYSLTWAVFLVGVIAAGFHLKAVRSDEFRTFTVRRRPAAKRSRFLPNQYTFCVHGLDRKITDANVIRKALLQFYDEEQICAIHLVLNYSNAFFAQHTYAKAVHKVHQAHRKIENLLAATGSRWSWWYKCCKWCSRKESTDFGDEAPSSESLRRSPLAIQTSSDSSTSEDLSYEECESLPATPTSPRRRSKLPAPEQLNVHVGQLPYNTLDSAALSPQKSARAVTIRSPAALSDRERSKLVALKAELAEREAAALMALKYLEDTLTEKPAVNVGTAFVSMTSWQAVRFALVNDFAHPACPVFRAFHSSVDGLTDGDSLRRESEAQHCAVPKWQGGWRVREAPPPEDIVWANMDIGRLQRAYRIFVVNLAIFVFLFTLTSSTIATGLLFSVASSLEKVLQDQSFVRVSVSGWLAPAFLYLINALLLPQLVSWGADASKFWKRSSRDRTVLYANVHYMVINSLVFPVLGTTSFQTLALFFTKTPWGRIPSILGQMTAGASGSFVLRYIINTICINSSMQLLQLPMFSQQRVLLKLGKKANRWDFDYGFWYAFHLAVLSVCIVFSVDFPLVPLGGAIFFTCKYWVDKYNLTMKVWRTRSESAGAVAHSAISFVFYFISMFMFLMAGYFFAVSLSRSSASTRDVARELFTDMRVEPSRPLNHRRGLSIGALCLLLASIVLAMTAAAEKAQRSIIMIYANRLRYLGHKLQVWLARRLQRWGLTAPQRGVTNCDVGDYLSPSKCEYLRKSYTHPFECENRLELVVQSMTSQHSA